MTTKKKTATNHPTPRYKGKTCIQLKQERDTVRKIEAEYSKKEAELWREFRDVQKARELIKAELQLAELSYVTIKEEVIEQLA